MLQPELEDINRTKSTGDSDWEEYLQKSSEQDLDRIIQRKMAVIARPWTHTLATSGKTIQGWLWKKRKSSTGYKNYYFALNGNQLYYYNDSNSKNARGIISISFVSRELKTTQKILEEVKSGDVSSSHILVFSAKGIDTFVAHSDDEMMQWVSSLQTVCQECLGHQEYETRDQAVEELLPVLAMKSDIGIQKLLRVMNVMDVAGFFPKKKRIKAGKLDMLQDDGTWQRMFFTLQGGVLYYYKSANDPPKGMISLTFSTVSTLKDPDMNACFILENPLCKFTLRGRHDVAIMEWMKAINLFKEGTKKKKAGKGAGYSLLDDTDDFDDITGIPMNDQANEIDFEEVYFAFGKRNRAILHYKFPSEVDLRHRKFVLPNGTTHIGRSKELTQLTVKDGKVSRQHCKIEVSEDKAVFYDLGSDHGSKINRKAVSQKLLEDGDKIKIGKTKMTFKVKPIHRHKRNKR